MCAEQAFNIFSEEQCKLIETELTIAVEPRKIAAYLCLHMGLMLGEVAALRWSDFDFNNNLLTLRYIQNSSQALIQLPTPRVLKIPPHVVRYLQKNQKVYATATSFIMSGNESVPPFYNMQNILNIVANRTKLSIISASDLRNAFIRRSIQAGMDLFSLCRYIDIRQPNVIVRRFAEYFDVSYDAIDGLEKYAVDYSPISIEHYVGPKGMNLLILGAGSQGPVVKEIAEAIGIFDKIAFLDDDPNNKYTIGPLSDVKKLIDCYPMATVSLGNSFLREKYMNELETLGYIVPSLIHPTATISPSCQHGRSVVIEARCVVSAGAIIGRGALISGASVIEAEAQIGAFTHIGSAVTVDKNAVVKDYARIPSGTVVRA